MWNTPEEVPHQPFLPSNPRADRRRGRVQTTLVPAVRLATTCRFSLLLGSSNSFGDAGRAFQDPSNGPPPLRFHRTVEPPRRARQRGRIAAARRARMAHPAQARQRLLGTVVQVP
ncbi:MAG: hypothetical protein OXG81_02760 [Acidobacteria bacterium]|nr:hypothetical protein [Acidobacteriota bacterium]